MEQYGWTYQELQETPEDVVADALELIRARATLRKIEEMRARARGR